MYSELCADTISTLIKDKGIIHGYVDMIETIGELISDKSGQDVIRSLKAIVNRIHSYVSQKCIHASPQESIRAKAYAFVYSLHNATIACVRRNVSTGTVVKTMASAAWEQLQTQDQRSHWNLYTLAEAAYNGWAAYHIVREWLPKVTPLDEETYAEDKLLMLSRCNVMLQPAVGMLRREHFVCIYTDHGPNARVYVVKTSNKWCMPGIYNERRCEYTAANVLCALIRQVNLPAAVIYRFAQRLIECVSADIVVSRPNRCTSIWFLRISDAESIGIGQTSPSLCQRLAAVPRTTEPYEWAADPALANDHRGCFINMEHLLLEPLINQEITNRILRHLCPGHIDHLCEWFSFRDVHKCCGNVRPSLPMTMMLKEEYMELSNDESATSTVPQPTLDGWLFTLYKLATGLINSPCDQATSAFADFPIATMMTAARELLRFVEPTSLSLTKKYPAATQYTFMYGVKRNESGVCRNEVNNLIRESDILHSKAPQSFTVDSKLLDVNGNALAEIVTHTSIKAYVSMQRAILSHDVIKTGDILRLLQGH